MADPSSTSRVRVITVAEQRTQANALSLLLSTSSEVDVVDSECFVDRARSSILRNRPDVVVISSTDDHLCQFGRLLDLRLAMPDLSFVIVPGERSGRSGRRPTVERAVTVLPLHFTLEDLLSAVTTMAARTADDHDRSYMSVPISF